MTYFTGTSYLHDGRSVAQQIRRSASADVYILDRTYPPRPGRDDRRDTRRGSRSGTDNTLIGIRVTRRHSSGQVADEVPAVRRLHRPVHVVALSQVAAHANQLAQLALVFDTF